MKTLKRVVVTGIGAVTSIGSSSDQIVQNLKAGISGIKSVTLVDTSELPVKFAGEISNFDPTDFLDSKEIRRNDRFIQLCLVASEMAIADAGLSSTNLEHAGVAVGVGLGGLKTIEDTAFNINESGFKRVGPFFVPSILSNLASGQVSIKFGIKGPNYAVSSACASGSQAIGQAFSDIQTGKRTIWLAGGAEAPITALSIAGFAAARTLSRNNENFSQASGPFDNSRDGFVLGEGAGMLILESFDSAIARNARIYAEILGFGIASDGHHVTEPEPNGNGAFQAMTEALHEAQIDPSSIDYVNAHATSTPVGDRVEAIALKRILTNNSRDVFVSSTKSQTGHLCGAAGSVEAVFCLLMMQNKFIAPAVNLAAPCSEFEFKIPTVANLETAPKIVMNNSFGFGGINTSMIFGAPR